MTNFTWKICLLGDFGVGKTSLIRRFVDQTFSERYLSTLGVRVDTKIVQNHDFTSKLVVWDIAGTNAPDTLWQTYLRGAQGVFLVCDGTRKNTFETLAILRENYRNIIGDVPCVGLVNKSDLADQWEITLPDKNYATWCAVSAKTGIGVEAAFLKLANAIHERQNA